MKPRMKLTTRYRYHLAALFCVTVWGATFVSTKVLIANSLTPAEIFLMRFAAAYILLLALSHAKLRADSLRDEAMLAAAGVTGGSLYFLTENMALEFSPASNVSLIVCTAPLWTALLLRSLYRSERMSRRQAVGSLIAFAGMTLVVLNGRFILHLEPKGDLLALGASLSWVCYSLLLKRIGGRYPALFITRKVFFYGVVTILPVFLLRPFAVTWEILARPAVWGNLLFLGIVASMLCYLLWNASARHIGMVKMTNYIYLNPLVTMLTAALFIGERITGAELAATVENSFKNSNYGDQFSGMVVKYTAEPDGKDENGRPVRGARTVVSIVLDDGTVVDIKDDTKTYRVAVNEYCATLPGSVFENKTPVQNVNEAPIDNISAIEALRAIGKANNGKLPLDLTERCVKVELVEEDPCEQYTDLDANAWYAESVHFALVNGLFVGFGDGTFRPEAALSRAMVATVLYRQAGSPAVTGTSTFPDLKDDWYADAVAWAQEAKVVIGDDKGLFRPDDDVTREEMVTMLYRFAASQNMDTTTTGDLSNFTDASSVQSYATEPMTWAVGNGIILGMGNNELAPRESATRAQFAAITARLAALK